MAAALNVPVSVMSTPGEGGAWGMALLAAFMIQRRDLKLLEDYLSQAVFSENEGLMIKPDPDDVKGFAAFMERYKLGFEIERIAVEVFR